MTEPHFPPDDAGRRDEPDREPDGEPFNTPADDADVSDLDGVDDVDDVGDVDDVDDIVDSEDVQDVSDVGGGGGDDDDDGGDDDDDDDGDDDDDDDGDDDDDDGDDDDDDDDDGAGNEDGESADQHRAVFVSTALPVPLRVAPLDDERAPGGTALGAFIGERLVARCAMPREAIDHLMELDLFAEPVALALLAVEEDPGLQCRLFALVPADRIMDDDDETASEPWRASVPSFEDSVAAMDDDDDDDDDDDGEDDDSAVASILLGHIVRFDRDRKFADDLTAEAVDVLQKIVLGGQLEDANSRAVDDLLDSL